MAFGLFTELRYVMYASRYWVHLHLAVYDGSHCSSGWNATAFRLVHSLSHTMIRKLRRRRRRVQFQISFAASWSSLPSSDWVALISIIRWFFLLTTKVAKKDVLLSASYCIEELIILPFWQRPAEIGEIISITSGPSSQISSLSKLGFNRF